MSIPAIYGQSALYMVVMQRVGRLPRKSIISLRMQEIGVNQYKGE